MGTYEFIDTTEYPKESILSAEAVRFNGKWLDNEVPGFRTLCVSGRELMSCEVVDEKIGNTDGTQYQYKRYPARQITITYQLTAKNDTAFRDAFNHLNGLLDVEEGELVFNDESDKYFIATKTANSEVTSGRNSVVGELIFYCTNPFKHSTVEKTFSAKLNADGILEARIVNEGTEDVPVSYDIVHNHENGYIGIVSEYGVMQYGKVEEADGEVYKQNEILSSGFPGYVDDHGMNCQSPSSTTQGTLGMVSAAGNQWLGLNGGQSSGAGHWNGGMKTITLPADSEGRAGARNFYCYTRHWFEAGGMGQTGAQTITFLTADNKVICCMSISKGDTAGNTAHVDWAAGGRHLKSMMFAPADNADNPYSQRLWRGDNDFRKEGEQLTIYWNSRYYSYVVPEIKDMECAKIQLWIGQWGARNLSGQYMKRNYIGAVDFSKMHVEKWRDVPNRYPAGSRVWIDGDAAKVYVNGMANMGDEMMGTKYFQIPPGETKVQFYHSDFSAPPPTIKARIREAYL